MYEFLILSLFLLLIWTAIFAIRKGLRKEMMLGSLIAMLFGVTEPIFVPEYWMPSTLFDLAAKTGFDIESFIFSFAVGGIAIVLYEIFFRVKHKKISIKEINKHRLHAATLFFPIAVFFISASFININPIYSASIALLFGAVTTLCCRPDLLKKMIWTGAIFAALYFASFLIVTMISPDFVKITWNFSSISGILILNVPLEELIWAFAFGAFWASLYEHIFWRKLLPQ